MHNYTRTLTKTAALAAAWLSRPVIMFWALPWLMILLVAGTVAQKYVGLYLAQKTFFSSFLFWCGPLPLPGGYTVTGLIFISLLAKFVTDSRWRWQRAGIILTHLGALILLAGGLLTALTAREGFIVIDEGGESAYVEDYHARVLTVTEDGEEILRLPADALKAGRVLGLEEHLPFNAEITAQMVNGTPQPRGDYQGKFPLRGAAEKVEMVPAPPALQNESNHGAISLLIRGTGADTDGVYLLTEVMPLYPQLEVKGKAYEIRFGKSTSTLPFAVALDDVEKDNHPGMDMARAYRSLVTIKDGDNTWPAEISMNNPLRYRGYTFYQSSYMVNEQGRESTVLSVVWNMGRLFPYIASAIISLGLILHLLIATGKRAALIFWAVMLCGSFTPAAQAQTPENLGARAPDSSITSQAPGALSLDDFAMIPVLHEGRLKPLETFAAALLHSFSGRRDIDGMDATAWLAEILFDPTSAAARPTFLIRNRDLQRLLHLTPQSGARYTLAQVSTGLAPHQQRIAVILQTPPDKRDARQRALVDLHHKVNDYLQLMRSFSLILPLDIQPPVSLLSTEERAVYTAQIPHYLDLRKLEERTHKKLQQIMRQKGDNPEAYSEDERAVALFSWQLQTLAAGGVGNQLFRVIPVTWDTEERASPWAVWQDGQGSPESAGLLAQWRAVALAWLQKDTPVWQEGTNSLRRALAPAHRAHFMAERLYNRLNPFQWALALYVIAAGMMVMLARQPRPLYFRAGLMALIAGALVHLGGIILRVYILSRPPVGTLYESLLFVSLICVIAGGALLLRR
ncbi:MAG TPA: cytochrome c biogenesis protein ResB, partial [Micavibrio sp.]